MERRKRTSRSAAAQATSIDLVLTAAESVSGRRTKMKHGATPKRASDARFDLLFFLTEIRSRSLW